MDTVDVKEFKVSSPVADDLVDPYTGAVLTIVGRVSGAFVTYSSPTAFTLSEPQESIERLYARASMRNGVEGMASKDESLKCAYTGAALSLERTPDGKWYFSGGFNPRSGRLSLAEYVGLASRGTGVTSDPDPCESIPTMESEKVDAPSTDAVGEELEQIAGEVCKSIGADNGRTTVSGFRRKKARQ